METKLLEHERAERGADAPRERMEQEADNSKKCPFCAEWIRAEAIKCRHCGEFLDGSGRSRPRPASQKWYYATGTIVIALLCLGPIALPLVWSNRRYKPLTRVIITVVVLAATMVCMHLVTQAYQGIMDQFDALGM